MNFNRLLNTKIGVVFISIMLGLGLATLFRKACNGPECLNFKGPRISEVNGNVYQNGDSCYKYSTVAATCDSSKKTLEFRTDTKEGFDSPTTVVPTMITTLPVTPTPTVSGSGDSVISYIWNTILGVFTATTPAPTAAI